MKAKPEQQKTKLVVDGLIAYLKKSKQLPILPQLVREALKKTDSHANQNKAVVTAAIDLNPAQIRELKGTLSTMTGRDIDIQVKHDPKIVAGLHIRLADKVIDASLKTAIETLTNTLSQ